ncbi:MAG: transcriptional regulator [Rhodospirillaceae bacterium]|nr:MAG: transcriptional regulator [Rhodospirillaceae bacterium]
MDIRTQIGLNVKVARKVKGWSQEVLAFETSLHRTYISGIERGIRNPTVTIISRMAEALDLAPADLLKKP